jgi:outer membrane protein G
MKKIIALLMLCAVGFVNAQAYKGKGDFKGQVGLSLQSGGTGINVSSDYGIGENISLGVSATYLLAVDNYETLGFFGTTTVDNADFIDKFDLKARFNANLGNVIGLDKSMDVYPGLDLGLRNFGVHAGFRYFFTDGFGVYGEAGVPITKYGGKSYGNDVYNNQFVFNVGASFNLGI